MNIPKCNRISDKGIPQFSRFFDFCNFQFNEVYNLILFSYPLVLLSNLNLRGFRYLCFFMCPHIKSVNQGMPVLIKRFTKRLLNNYLAWFLSFENHGTLHASVCWLAWQRLRKTIFRPHTPSKSLPISVTSVEQLNLAGSSGEEARPKVYENGHKKVLGL